MLNPNSDLEKLPGITRLLLEFTYIIPYLGLNDFFPMTSKTKKDTNFLTRRFKVRWNMNSGRGTVTKLVKCHSLKWRRKKYVSTRYVQRENQDASCDDSGTSENY